MPFIDLKTNAKVSAQQSDALKTRLGEAITALGKSENWLMVSVEGEKSLYFKGDAAASAIAEISLYGRASDAQYDRMTKETTAIISEILSVPADRIYVKYEEVAHWGFGGYNF